jgi:ribonucrease Y
MNSFLLTIISIILTGLSLAFGILWYKSKSKKFTQEDFDSTLSDNLNNALSQKEVEFQKQKIDFESNLKTKSELEIEKTKLNMSQKLQDEERKFNEQTLSIQNEINRKQNDIDHQKQVIEDEKYRLEENKKTIKAAKELLETRTNEINLKEKEYQELLDSKLEEISGLSKEDARKLIFDKTREEVGNDMIQLQSKLLENAEEEVNYKAREIVSLAIQRCSSEVTNELTITVIKLSSDDEKGKLIGRGGRNIQWIEKTLGVELIIDDTPDVVTISGFSGIRRNIAKKTVEKLLLDGRIHPASIEEMYEKAKGEINEEINQAGEDLVNELGIYDFAPKLVRLLGRLKFRNSYGQNMLKHSLEMAKLAGLLADELNTTFQTRTPIDRMICVKGALLHDIGKAVDEEMVPKGNHIELGEKICDMFGLDWRIKKCISSHHLTGGDVQSYYDEEHGFCIEACVVDACDNISGSRPGARKETMEAYFQRMESLEGIANNTKGVSKSFIMKGGKVLWVFFDAENINLAQMQEATRQITTTITDNVKAPYKIEVTGFLENRIVSYAG